MTDERRSTKDTATLLLIGIVGLFILGSLVALIVAAFEGQPGGSNIWAGLFSLCTAILGAVGGYLGGQAVGSVRRSTPPPPPPVAPPPSTTQEAP